MRRALAVLALATLAHAGTVFGTAHLRKGQARTPLAGARIVARSPDSSQVLQSSNTDSSGRYFLANLPSQRVILSALKPGYFSRAVASGDEGVLVDLAPDEQLSGIDFDIQPGGVITGRITDDRGEAMENAEVTAWRGVDRPGGRRSETAAKTRTDDLGRYRLFGLEPGFYLVLAAPAPRVGGPRLGSCYYPDCAEETRAHEIEVIAGADVPGIDITLRPEPLLRIRGRIAGVQPDEYARVRLKVATVRLGALEDFLLAASPDRDGSFIFSDLPRGSYVLTADLRPAPGRAELPRTLTRRKVDLSADLDNFELRPVEPGQVSGRVVFGHGANAKPPYVHLRAVDRAGVLPFDEAVARAPAYRFAFSNIQPGSYTIDVRSPAKGYVQAVRVWGRPAAAELLVSERASVTVELELGFEMGHVRGTVKTPGAGTFFPHARVLLARPDGGGQEIQMAQADQKGRFVFHDVRPGEYLVCAWPSGEPGPLRGPEPWQCAGDTARRVALKPGGEAEIDLHPAGIPSAPASGGPQ